MRLKHLSCLVTFAPFLIICVEAESVNNHRRKGLLSYLNTKYFQQRSFHLFATANNTLCSQHFQIYLDQINVSYWALQMFDSSTKFPESVLMGQSVFLGNFDECIGVQNVQTENGSFSGQYCLVGFQGRTASHRKRNPQSSPDSGGFRENVPDVIGSDRIIVPATLDTVLMLSFCIPSTCSAKDFEDIVNYNLKSVKLPVVATVNETNCQTNEGRKLTTGDWVTIAVFAFIILVIIASTAYDLAVKGTKKELLTAFSVYSNGKKLLSTKSSEDTLHAIHGMRFITMCWVVWAYRYIVDSAVPSINFSTVFDFVKDAGRLYISNGTLSGDTFLVLGGLLVSYVFLKQMKYKSSGFNVPLYYLHRYIRLTPPYAAFILFNATLYRYVAGGPLLAAVTDRMAENCHRYWWTNILYINNYVGVDQRCLEQSWYLSVDMQLYILSPIILYPLWKWPRKWNILLLAFLIVAGIISPFTISHVNKISADLLHGNEGRVLEQQELYVATHSRFGPWVIGVAFGYFIHDAKKRELKLSTIQIVAGWIFSNVALLGSLNGIYSFYQDGADKTVSESALYNGLFRNVWAFGVGVTIFMCVTGYGGAANILLSWKLFPTLSRLSYCVYLTYANYQILQTFSARTAIYIADLTEWPAFFADVVISLIVATLLSLCFELPAINLEKCLLRRGTRNREIMREETLQELQENNAVVHINGSMEEQNSSEGEKSNFTDVTLEETNGDHVEQYVIRE